MRRSLKGALTGLVLGFSLHATAFAQSAEGRFFGSESLSYATEAQSLQRENAHKKAIKRLKKGLKLEGLTAFETSTMYQMMGASYYAREENEKTIEAFEAAINAGGLSQKDKGELQANIARLNIAEQNYALGAAQLEAYFQEGGAQKPTLVKMALKAHLQAKNREAALPWAEVMLRQGLIQSQNDHELAIYLFDSPEKRANQMQVAQSLYAKWPNDPDVLARIKRLNVKAQRDGIPVIAIAGE